jgi:hypothetical protein
VHSKPLELLDTGQRIVSRSRNHQVICHHLRTIRNNLYLFFWPIKNFLSATVSQRAYGLLAVHVAGVFWVLYETNSKIEWMRSQSSVNTALSTGQHRNKPNILEGFEPPRFICYTRIRFCEHLVLTFLFVWRFYRMILNYWSVIPWSLNGSTDNNLESSYILMTLK